MKFRKKPVVIDAMQMNGQTVAICKWLEANGQQYTTDTDLHDASKDSLFILTREGTMRADPGDWVIRGVKGEFYPCKPDIFAATYDSV